MLSMARIDGKSITSLILDQERHDIEYPKYLKTLKKLTKSTNVSVDEYFAKLVNFKKNQAYPKHNWFDYKHGYSEDLVKAIIASSGISRNDMILDPFCGVGTTNVVAQSLGIKNIGFDISPIALLAARVKTRNYTDADKSFLLAVANSPIVATKSKSPESDLIVSAYHPEVLNKLNDIYAMIENVTNPTHQDFLKLAFLSLIEKASNRRKDGNGIKIAFKPPKNIDVQIQFCDRIKQMISDLDVSNFKSTTDIIEGSFKEADVSKLKEKIGLTIFSPPYANCFDYFEVYKLEMWMGRFVKSYADFEPYRSQALRSHVNSSFDHSISNINKDVDQIAELLTTYNLWNKNIPDMIRGYFDDMTDILQNIFEVSKPGAEVHIIVANSGYKGILVPTDLLLAEIAREIGFDCDSITYARKIRSSSQQMKLIEETYQDLMRESIVVLRKPMP
jgi:hypothetical protein